MDEIKRDESLQNSVSCAQPADGLQTGSASAQPTDSLQTREQIKTERKEFFSNLTRLVAPIAGQNLISAAVNSADVIMLGFVGQTAIAASSLAGNVAFILFMIMTGLSSGLVMLCAQYWGKKDLNSIRTLLGIALRISLSASIIFFLLAFITPELLMKIFTSDANLIETGAVYLRAVSVAYLCMGISQVFQAAFKSVEKVKIVTLITTTSLLLNIGLNAVFIFGLFGIPKLGIFGVGLATSIARVIETIMCLIYARSQKELGFSLKAVGRFNKLLTKDFIHYSAPAMGNEIVWGAAFSMYSVILGHLGEDIVAANSVVNVVRNLATVVCFGMAYGGAVIIGKNIGANEMKKAERNARRLALSTIGSGLLGAVMFLCLKPAMPYIAQLTESASAFRDKMLIVNAFSILGASINTVLICGIFRAGGDAKFGFIADTICMWGWSVPLGLLNAFVFKLPPLTVYIILYIDEYWKMPFVVAHYFKKGWLKNITR